jgi:hypothetical protein
MVLGDRTVVAAKTLVQHGVALALRHVFELAGLEIAQLLLLARGSQSCRPDFVGLRGRLTGRLTGNRGAGKLFRAQSLYYVDAGGACRWKHRSDYCRA